MQHADLTIATEGRAPPSPPLAGNATLHGLLEELREGDALLQLQLPRTVHGDVVDLGAVAAIVRSGVRAFDRVLRRGQHALLVVLPQAEPRSVQVVMNRLQLALADHLPTGALQVDLVLVGHAGGATAYQELRQRLAA